MISHIGPNVRFLMQSDFEKNETAPAAAAVVASVGRCHQAAGRPAAGAPLAAAAS